MPDNRPSIVQGHISPPLQPSDYPSTSPLSGLLARAAGQERLDTSRNAGRADDKVAIGRVTELTYAGVRAVVETDGGAHTYDAIVLPGHSYPFSVGDRALLLGDGVGAFYAQRIPNLNDEGIPANQTQLPLGAVFTATVAEARGATDDFLIVNPVDYPTARISALIPSVSGGDFDARFTSLAVGAYVTCSRDARLPTIQDGGQPITTLLNVLPNVGSIYTAGGYTPNNPLSGFSDSDDAAPLGIRLWRSTRATTLTIGRSIFSGISVTPALDSSIRAYTAHSLRVGGLIVAGQIRYIGVATGVNQTARVSSEGEEGGLLYWQRIADFPPGANRPIRRAGETLFIEQAVGGDYRGTFSRDSQISVQVINTEARAVWTATITEAQ